MHLMRAIHEKRMFRRLLPHDSEKYDSRRKSYRGFTIGLVAADFVTAPLLFPRRLSRYFSPSASSCSAARMSLPRIRADVPTAGERSRENLFLARTREEDGREVLANREAR